MNGYVPAGTLIRNGSSLDDAMCRQGYDPAIFEPLLVQNDYEHVVERIVAINSCAINKYLSGEDRKKVKKAIEMTAQEMCQVYDWSGMSADNSARAQFMDFVYNYTNDANYYSGSMNLNTTKINMAGIVAYKAYCAVFEDGIIPDIFDSIKSRVASILANTSWRITKVLHKGAIDNIKKPIFMLHPSDLLEPIYYDEFIKDIVQMKAAEYLDERYSLDATPLTVFLQQGKTIPGDYQYEVPTLKSAPPHLITLMEQLKQIQKMQALYKIIPSQQGGRRLVKKGVKRTPTGKTRTSRHIKIGNRSAVVYEGPRGGEYVKLNGEFVSVARALRR